MFHAVQQLALFPGKRKSGCTMWVGPGNETIYYLKSASPLNYPCFRLRQSSLLKVKFALSTS